MPLDRECSGNAHFYLISEVPTTIHVKHFIIYLVKAWHRSVPSNTKESLTFVIERLFATKKYPFEQSMRQRTNKYNFILFAAIGRDPSIAVFTAFTISVNFAGDANAWSRRDLDSLPLPPVTFTAVTFVINESIGSTVIFVTVCRERPFKRALEVRVVSRVSSNIKGNIQYLVWLVVVKTAWKLKGNLHRHIQIQIQN